jgi:hypothetical protein
VSLLRTQLQELHDTRAALDTASAEANDLVGGTHTCSRTRLCMQARGPHAAWAAVRGGCLSPIPCMTDHVTSRTTCSVCSIGVVLTPMLMPCCCHHTHRDAGQSQRLRRRESELEAARAEVTSARTQSAAAASGSGAAAARTRELEREVTRLTE